MSYVVPKFELVRFTSLRVGMGRYWKNCKNDEKRRNDGENLLNLANFCRRYVTIPLALWHWTCVVHRVSSAQTVYQIWAKSNSSPLSYCMIYLVCTRSFSSESWCSISLKFGTYFNHVTPGVAQTLKTINKCKSWIYTVRHKNCTVLFLQ